MNRFCLTCGLNHAPSRPSPTIRARRAEEALRELQARIGGSSDQALTNELRIELLGIIEKVIE